MLVAIVAHSLKELQKELKTLAQFKVTSIQQLFAKCT